MKIKNHIAVLLLACLPAQGVIAQPHKPSGASHGGVPVDSWEVSVRQMPVEMRAEITETMSRLKGTDEDRGIIADIGSAVGVGLVSGLVDAIVSETYNLAHYRKRQKQEWMQMIQKENNFTDSITSIKGLKDFYSSNSRIGALDPSNINFDGIEIRGIRNGQQVIYMSCSIDRDRLDNMFQHSKFNLVLDSLVFNPYMCHLPNVTANGIRTMKEIKKGKASVEGDTIIRPGTGGNGFSFEERDNLRVAIDFSIYSSWVNQLVQVHKNVELGEFKFTVSIPENTIGAYTYSREEILNEAKSLPEKDRNNFLEKNLIAIEGDSFVVPRSFMPLDSGQPMWGTGEYNIKVKVRESCQFANNSEKAKHWREDYKRLRQMQKRSGEVQEYFKTLWNQYGNTLVKTSYKTALSTAVNDLIPLKKGSSSVSGKGLGAPQSAGQGTGQGSKQPTQGVTPPK